MKTPQLKHGVYDIATGEEITTPLGLPRDPATVLADLSRIDGVIDVHDLHLWTLTSGMNVATAHVTIGDSADQHEVLDAGRPLLRDRYAIDHSTLQVEPPRHADCPEADW